jgi:hypothetical protein
MGGLTALAVLVTTTHLIVWYVCGGSRPFD